MDVENTNGDVVTFDESQVTLTISSGANVGGTFIATAVNGVATFNNVIFDLAAANYTLTASDQMLTTATSADFTIAPAAASQVVFVQGPTNATAGAGSVPTSRWM